MEADIQNLKSEVCTLQSAAHQQEQALGQVSSKYNEVTSEYNFLKNRIQTSVLLKIKKIVIRGISALITRKEKRKSFRKKHDWIYLAETSRDSKEHISE